MASGESLKLAPAIIASALGNKSIISINIALIRFFVRLATLSSALHTSSQFRSSIKVAIA